MFVAVDFSKYEGRYVALVDNRVIATGKDAKTVWVRAHKKNPAAVPTLVKVPRGELFYETLNALRYGRAFDQAELGEAATSLSKYGLGVWHP